VTNAPPGGQAGPPDDAPFGYGEPASRDSSRLLWVVVVLVVAALVALRYWDGIAAPFQDRAVAAFVALLPDGEEVARDGEHRLAAGARFRLFAVLEAKTFTGSTVWYTEAPALSLGGREIPAAALRRWPEGGRVARVRWWTLEGFAPYLPVATSADLDRFELTGAFHPEWGAGWSVDGVVDPRNAQLEPESPLRPLPFGSQRWQVRIELLAGPEALTPSDGAASADGAEALARRGAATALIAALPAPLAVTSAVFGLTQVEPGPELAAADAGRVAGWRRLGLVFERADLLREHVEAAGTEPAALAWRHVDLDATPPPWGAAGVAPGDLLQGGGRIVVLFRDLGELGRLDRADLVFDFYKGAKVRRVDEVFRDAGGLALQWASLGGAGGTPGG
jgi:hypothetical protein